MIDVASVLRGAPATGDDLREALAEMSAEGYVLVQRDKLTALHSAVDFDRLNTDIDLLAHVLVDVLWDDRRDRRVAA